MLLFPHNVLYLQTLLVQYTHIKYFQAAKKATSLGSKNHLLWTTLGVIAATPGAVFVSE